MLMEYIKYAPEEVDALIAEILNIAAETDDVPNELVQEILCAFQKPGKIVGPPEHLRPIFMRERTIERIDATIPNSQAAYRRGRSTTEHVFAVKILAEKVIASIYYTIYIPLFDMPKAFDTVARKLLTENLSSVIDTDEFHMI